MSFFYGESLRAHPLKVAMKMLAARLAFVVPLPLVLPDKRFLLNHYGAKMYMSLTNSPILLDCAFGVYEYWTTRLVSEVVKEGMTIADVGAHEGYYSIMLAKLMHDKGRVLAFEPDPDNSAWLKRNIEANGYRCIEVHQYALADTEGEATFYPGGGVGSLVFRSHVCAAFNPPSNPFTVQTRMLDDVLREANVRNLDLVKVDVEGADLLVLKGAEQTLRTMNGSIIMDVDVGSHAERKELYELLVSCGFNLYSIGRRLQPIKTADEVSLFLGKEAGRQSSARTLRLGRLAAAKTRIKDMLPRMQRYLGPLSYIPYAPVSWVRAPTGVRQIYATKQH